MLGSCDHLQTVSMSPVPVVCTNIILCAHSNNSYQFYNHYNIIDKGHHENLLMTVYVALLIMIDKELLHIHVHMYLCLI